MKKTLILLALLASTVSVRAQYHVRVECYGGLNRNYWQVSFTNDNWKTHDTLKESSANLSYDDFDNFYTSGYSYGAKIFDDDSEAKSYGRKFKTYLMCVKDRQIIYNRYIKNCLYLRAHPPHPKRRSVKLKLQKECCKITNIY